MSDSDQFGELDDLYDQGLLTDQEHQRAADRVASRERLSDGGGRRFRPLAWWPVLALLVGIGLIIFAVVGTSGGSKTQKTAGIAVDGAVVIQVAENAALPDDASVPPGTQFNKVPGYSIGKGCHTTPGLADIKAGAPVVIAKAGGATLVSTTLKPGVYDSNADCVFGFTAAVIKTDSYTVKVAQRNPVTFSQADIASPQLDL